MPSKCLSALFGLLLLAVSSCASLPDRQAVRHKASQVASGPLTLANGEGLLGPEETERVLERKAAETQGGKHLFPLLKLGETVTGYPLTTGNRVELLIDAKQTYREMFSAIRNAQHSVHILTYLFADDQIGEQLAAILKDKVAEGVEVRVIFDAIGGIFVNEGFYRELRDAGVKTAKFNPVNPLESPKLWRINHREHSKLVIVDGQRAFTGGMNISNVYEKPTSGLSLPDPLRIVRTKSWRDTHVEITGPSVAYFQKRFIESWNAASDEELAFVSDYMAGQARQGTGSALLRLLESQGADNKFEIYELYLTAIELAERKIWLTQAYFAPNQELLEALQRAALRGVDVRIILPGVLDHGIVYHSSRARYGALLEAGVKLYAFKERVLHAKTMVVDSVWSTVGSANLDFRSFIHNNELNISVFDKAFAKVMEAQFLSDIQESSPITLEDWEERPLSDKLKEGLSRLLDYWL